jgi:hypothetical protein
VVAAVELPITDEGGPGEGRSCGRVPHKLPTFWELDDTKEPLDSYCAVSRLVWGSPPAAPPPARRNGLFRPNALGI